MPKPVLYTSAPVVPQAKTPKSKAGLLTRPFRSLPGGRLAKSAKVPEQLSGASGADFRKTQKPVVTRLFGLTAAGTVADSHGVPLAIARAKIDIFPKKQQPERKKIQNHSGTIQSCNCIRAP